jgi:two-component system sensor histidine kinase/response regulator
MMGGEIGVESIPGEGSTFWFTIRFGLSHAAEKIGPPLKGHCILVVDDNATSHRVLQIQLERNGCEVLAVESGPRRSGPAFRRAPSAEFRRDTLRFPNAEMDGLDLVAAIRYMPDRKSVPILMLASQECRERCTARM